MKNISILLIFLAIIQQSCQRVIDLDLESIESRIVIQGNIYNESGPYTVEISRSVDFDEKNEYPQVYGAFVTISDNSGVIDTLEETSTGIYTTSKLEGVPGRTYTLSVNLDDEIYTASSTMPDPVDIDSIYVDESTMSDEYEVFIDFVDPANIENYYRIVKFINSKQMDEFYTISDDLYEGDTITYSPVSMGMNRDEIDTGDKVTIWLEAVDEDVYEYFRTASGDASQSASPSNPVSNITNGALGYFNACSVTKEVYRVPLLD